VIRIAKTDEPLDPSFEELVRKPGKAFLAAIPNPNYKQWKHHDYWRGVAPVLRKRYSGICAYSCYFIHEVTGDDTIEHFLPKTPHPTLAYEWTNYRYVCGKLNTWKRTDENVLDPFEIEDGWFNIEFPSLLVKASGGLDARLILRIRSTITQLKLNEDDPCIRCRQRIIEDYCSGDISFDYLKRHAPFLGREIERQGLIDKIWDIMSLSHLRK
jgi:hypothetical protein